MTRKAPTSTSGSKRNNMCPEREEEGRTKEDADALARKQKLNLEAGVAAAIEAIDGVIEDLADEHEIAFEKASMLVHIGIDDVGRVFEDRHCCRRRPPSIEKAYRFCRARVEDGRWKDDDGLERAGAVRIVHACELSGGDYRTLSEADQAALVALLQDNRNARERDAGIIGEPEIQLQDIRTTMDRVAFELEKLRIHSEFEYFLIGARSNADTPASVTPITCVSEIGGEFVARYLKLEAAALAHHFSAYAMNHGGIPGIIRALTSDIHKGDKKSAIKSVVMPMLHRQYQNLTRRENPRLDWTKWAKGVPDSNGVVLRGWPLQCAPMALSNVRTADEMKKILEAVIKGDLYFELVGNGGGKEDHADAWNATTSLYEPGGFIVRFENEPKNTRKTAPERGDRKRKEPDARLGVMKTNSDSNADPSPDTSSSPSLRSSKRFARTPAESTVPFSCQDRGLFDLANPSPRDPSPSGFGAEQQLPQPPLFSFADALGAVL